MTFWNLWPIQIFVSVFWGVEGSFKPTCEISLGRGVLKTVHLTLALPSVRICWGRNHCVTPWPSLQYKGILSVWKWRNNYWFDSSGKESLVFLPLYTIWHSELCRPSVILIVIGRLELGRAASAIWCASLLSELYLVTTRCCGSGSKLDPHR